MNVSATTRPEQWKSGGLILPVFSDVSPLKELGKLDQLGWLKQSPAFADHNGTAGELTLCHAPGVRKSARTREIARVMAVGLGKRQDFTMEAYREAMAKAIRALRDRKIATPALLLPYLEWLASQCDMDHIRLVEESVLGVLLPSYSFDAFRMKDREKNAPFSFDTLHILADKRMPVALKSAIHSADVLASGIFRARDLGNGPANSVTPSFMAETAREMAKKYGFTCRVLGRMEMERLGMGALLAVARGAAQEPRFIVLEHTPQSKKPRDPIVLIGKGITFDSGGISLKPSAGMERMKTDMAGAAAVLGVFESIGRNPSAVSSRVVGLMPCTENMPDGNATRPGDVVTAMNGVTVEIVNTDAEGRLVLADALAYAQKEWTPAAMVDVATLTGACVVALGRHAAGLFCDDSSLRDKLLALTNENGETCWHLPLWEKLREGLKSETADTMNSGPREGATIAAALFLKLFVEKDIPWAHIDMAATGHSAKPTATGPAGATGFGVRTLYELVRDGVKNK